MAENDDSKRAPMAKTRNALYETEEEKALLEAKNGLLQFDYLKKLVDDQLSNDEEKITLTPSIIRELHYFAIQGIYSCSGNYRYPDLDVSIGGSKHQVPPAIDVPPLVQEMCDYVNANWEKSSPVHLAAYLLWRVNWIHPFNGGNGRTARAIMYLILCSKLGYWLPGLKTIAQHIEEDRIPYYNELKAADAADLEGEIDVSQMEKLLESLLSKQLLEIIEDATSTLTSNGMEIFVNSGMLNAAVTVEKEEVVSIKYIVELDLSSYSDISDSLEQSIGAGAVKKLNLQIKNFVNKALIKVEKRSEDTPQKGTGDGAIVALDSACEAVAFAKAVHEEAGAHNEGKSVELAQRHFRIGIYKGEVVIERETTPSGEFKSFEFHGSTVGKAVRLEAACCSGEILVCPPTFSELPNEIKSEFGSEELVKGKRDETFNAHRLKVVDPAPWEQEDGENSEPAQKLSLSPSTYAKGKEILLETASRPDEDQYIVKRRVGNNIVIHVKEGSNFNEPGNRESEAMWEHVLDELLDADLIKSAEEIETTWDMYKLTYKGYQLVKELKINLAK